MNILLIEQECFEIREKKNIHTSPISLFVGLDLRAYTQGLVYVLAKKGSLYEKIAKDFGFECLYAPEGFASGYSLSRVLKEHEISFVHTFDFESAKLVKSLFFWCPKLRHFHSENRFTENSALFSSKYFKNTEAFLFADNTFKKYFSLSLEGESKKNIKNEVLPIFPLKKAFIGEVNLPKLEDRKSRQEVTAKNGKKKIRFFIPTPLLLKSTEVILEALELFDQFEGYNFHWEAYFFGQGFEIKEIIAKAEKHNVDKHIIILSENEYEFSFNADDFCIVPTNLLEYDMNPLLWAWQNSLPTLLTSRISYCEYIENFENVIIPDALTPVSLSGGLHRLIHEKDLCDRLVESSIKSLENFYSYREKNPYLHFYLGAEKK